MYCRRFSQTRVAAENPNGRHPHPYLPLHRQAQPGNHRLRSRHGQRAQQRPAQQPCVWVAQRLGAVPPAAAVKTVRAACINKRWTLGSLATPAPHSQACQTAGRWMQRCSPPACQHPATKAATACRGSPSPDAAPAASAHLSAAVSMSSVVQAQKGCRKPREAVR